MNNYKSISGFIVLSAVLLFAFVNFGCEAVSGNFSGKAQGGGVASTSAEIEAFTATDFIGEMTSEAIWVLDSRLSWKPYTGAAYYDVFIDGEKTNDAEIKTTTFRTAFDGNVDVDAKMGDVPKIVVIEVRACTSDKKIIAKAEVKKTIPAKPAYSDLKINGQTHTANMEVINPVSIQVKLNNAIKFINEDKTKALQNLWNYVEIAQYDNPLPVVYDFDETTGIMTVTPLGALKGNKNFAVGGYKFRIKEKFPDKNRMPYTPGGAEEFTFKIAKITSSEPLKVEKILINGDESQNLITNSSVTDIMAKGSSVSILFNQLIDVSSYTPAGTSETGSKGGGIYITESETGKGADPARLINPLFERVHDSGVYKTKVSFEMAGKAFFTQEPEALKGTTRYYIVVDDDIKSGGNTALENEIRKSFTTGEAVKTLRKLTVYNGKIQGKSETVIKLAEGDEFTIIAEIPEGKIFDGWHVGEYYDPPLTAEQKMSETLTLKMRDYDTTFSAIFH